MVMDDDKGFKIPVTACFGVLLRWGLEVPLGEVHRGKQDYIQLHALQ